MRRAQLAIDGRAPSSALVSAVEAVAGHARDALLAWCERAGQHEYASLAPLVFDAEASDPYAAGWIIKLKLAPGTKLDHLLTPEQYEKQIASQGH